MDISAIIQDIGAFTQEAILIADADQSDGAVLGLRWINPAFTALTGYELKDTQGRTAGMLAGAKTDPETLADIIDRLGHWNSFTSEIICHRKDGSDFWGQLSFQPVLDEAYSYRFWVCLIRDITENRIQSDFQRDLALIAEHTADMVAVLDANQKITWVNSSFRRLTGYCLGDSRGQVLVDLLRAVDNEAGTLTKLKHALANGKPGFAELLSRRKDGSRFVGSVEIQPVHGPDRKILKYVSLIRDITARRTLELRYMATFEESNASTSIKTVTRLLMGNGRLAGAYEKTADWFAVRETAARAGGAGLAERRLF